MDFNGGKPLSPWKAPSKISLKRIQHKINSDLSIPTNSNLDKTSQKPSLKRNRLVANKFALSRSISTPTPNDNLEKNSHDLANDQRLLAKMQQIDKHFHSTIKSFSFDDTLSNKIPDETVETFPVDWSLKTSCRFYCPENSSFLNNYQKLRSQDESIALEYLFSHDVKSNSKALFRSLTSYWIYPYLPWLKLFPRSHQQLNSNLNPLDEQCQISLQTQWKIAFQSLFQSFRTKFIPYFYFCANTFNILFREDSIAQFVAIINPTTSGFRATLEKEGIEFTIVDENESKEESAAAAVEEEVEEEDKDEENVDENDATCAQWLEDMGLTNTTSSTTEKRTIKSNEKLGSHTILIKEISSVNSLFNYLLNKSDRISISLTGPLMGIPPTLISSRPFLNSTLKYLNVHFQSNSIVTIDDGPLLPTKIHDLWTLFTSDQQQAMQMICTNLGKTAAFNYDNQVFKTIKHLSIDQQKQIRAQFATT